VSGYQFRPHLHFTAGNSPLPLRQHIGLQNGVHAGLVAFSLGPKPLQNLGIKPHGDLLLVRWLHKSGVFKKVIAKLWDVAVIDLVITPVGEGLQSLL
jgi:hypothetical protein